MLRRRTTLALERAAVGSGGWGARLPGSCAADSGSAAADSGSAPHGRHAVGHLRADAAAQAGEGEEGGGGGCGDAALCRVATRCDAVAGRRRLAERAGEALQPGAAAVALGDAAPAGRQPGRAAAGARRQQLPAVAQPQRTAQERLAELARANLWRGGPEAPPQVSAVLPPPRRAGLSSPPVGVCVARPIWAQCSVQS